MIGHLAAFRIALVTLGVLLLSTMPANAREVPGTTEAQFSVSPDGAASYVVPLRVPPGTGGVEPKLSLSYSSRGGPSAYGHGWAISGLSVIQRGPRNLRDDGEVTSVQLKSSDALYLDGEKLIEVPSADPNVKEYRVRIDSIARIRTYDGNASGPGRVVVETRAGLVMSYGVRSDSRVTLGSGETISWLCDQIIDRAGNYMTFHYLFDQTAGGTGIEYVIDRVTYTGNAHQNLLPYAELKFNYRDVAPYGSRYIKGQRTIQSRQLASIVSSYKGQTLRTYTPRYSEATDTQFFFTLASLTESGAAGTAFRPLRFDYTAATPHWTPRSLMSGIQSLPGLGDVKKGLSGAYRYLTGGASGNPAVLVATSVGGKTLRDMFEFDPATKRWSKVGEPPVILLAADSGAAASVAVADIDGDGRDDLLVSADGIGNSDGVHINKGGGSWTSSTVAPPVPIVGGSLRASGLLATDILDATGTVRRGFVWDYVAATGARERGAAFWNGSDWSQRSSCAPKAPLGSDGQRLAGVFSIDVDADGVRELVYLQRLAGGHTRSLIYKLGGGSCWTPFTDQRFAMPIMPPADGAIRFIDMNKDGHPDLVWSYQDAIGLHQGIRLATKTGWAPDPRPLPPVPFWTEAMAASPDAVAGELVDLTGDGTPDFFLADANDRIAYAFDALKGSWEPVDELHPPAKMAGTLDGRTRTLRIASLDGDAQPEWLDLSIDDDRLVPTVYSFLPANGWRPDRNYAVPVDIAAFDKVDLGVRFIDLNADGYSDLVWSRRRTDGSTDAAAYIFTPNRSEAWQRDDRYVLPEPLVNEDYKDAGVLLADINGDGLIDILVGRRIAGSDRLEAFLNCTRADKCKAFPTSQISGFWVSAKADPTTVGLVPKEVFVEDGVGSLGAQVMDMNGDGLTDIVVARIVERTVATSDEEQQQTGQPTKPIYALYARTYLNTDGSGWTETPGHRLRVPLVRPIVRDPDGTGDDEGFAETTMISTGAQLLDLNNDRLPDLIFSYQAFERRWDPAKHRYAATRELRSGGEIFQDGVWTAGAGYTPAKRLDDDKSAPQRQMQFADVNGDGLVDMVFAEGAASETRLNTGTAWSLPDPGYQIPAAAIRDSKGDQGFRLLDVNGDMLVDVVYSWTTDSGAIKGVRLNTGVGFAATNAPATLEPPIAFAEHERGDTGVRPTDLNGDGLVDLVQAYKRSDASMDKLVYVNETDQPFLMTGITDGMGFHTLITQRSFLAYQYPEDKAAGMPVMPVRSSPLTERPSRYPIIHAPLPGYLVTAMETGGPGVAARHFRYTYDGYRVDVLSGRSLGFEEQVTFDVDRRSETRIKYLQTEGALGSIASTEQRIGDTIVARTLTDFSLVTIPGAPRRLGTGGSHTPIYYQRTVSSVKSETWDLLGKQIGGQEDRFQYDANANPVHIETRYPDGGAVETRNRYVDDVLQWQLGRLAEASVVLSTPGQPSLERRSRFTYDDTTGLLASETANADTALATTTYYGRDGFGNKTVLTVAIDSGLTDRTERYEADTEGRFVIAATNAIGLRTTTILDPISGATLRRTDANGLTVRFAYDDLQRLVSETTPNGVVTTSQINFVTGQAEIVAVSRRQTANLPATETEIDAAARPRRVREPGWGGRIVSTEIEYDVLGRVLSSSAPHFTGDPILKTSKSYDALDRVVREIRPDGSVVSAAFDGLMVRNTNALGQTSYSYSDLRGRVERTVDALGGETRFTYDAGGRTIATRNALGQVAEQVYDVAGRRISFSDPTLGHWSYSYTIFGQLESQTDPRGKTVRMTYDAIGRITSRTAGTSTESWTYDTSVNGRGKLAEARVGIKRLRTFAYDTLSQLRTLRTVVGRDSVSSSFEYDDLGRVTRVAYSTGVQVRNTYDIAGFWRDVTVVDGAVSTLAYRLGSVDAVGRVRAETLGNGVITRRRYDDATGRLLSTTSMTGGGVTVQDLNLAYDAVGNVRQMRDAATGRTSDYNYDGLNRLVHVTGNREPEVAVTYDALGNILRKGEAVYQYCDRGGQRNLLCGVQTGKQMTALEYDAAGNVVRYGERELLFDDQGRVSSITGARLGSIRTNYSDFTYGADGELETQRTRDGATAFDVVYMGDIEVMREKFTPPHLPTSERTRVRHFINAPSGVIGFYEKTSQHFPLRFTAATYGALRTDKPERVTRALAGFVYFGKDHLGSLRLLMDGTGKVLQRFDYDPWGKRIGPEAGKYHSVRQGFSGHETLDNLDLVHMGGRVYSPELARFLSPDAVVQAPGFSQAHNRYAYVLNNPMSMIDPTGYWGIDDIVSGVGDALSSVGHAVGSIVDAVVGKPLAWVGEQLAKGGRWLQQNWRVVVIVAATVALGPAGTFAGAMLMGAAIGGFSAVLYGGSFEDVLRGAALGAITGGAFNAAGSIIQHYQLGTMAAASLHGVVGGASSVMQGGRFESGFLSSFVNRSLGGQIEEGGSAGSRVARAAVVGGLASEVGGGSFENGAITAAFAQMYNEESHASQRMRQFIKNRGADKLNTEFEQNLFDRWAQGGSGNLGLTDVEFKELTDYADSHPKAVTKGPNPGEWVVNFYDSDKYDYSLGRATLIKDDNGVWVGMKDSYNFDPKPWGVRSIGAETATRLTNQAQKLFGDGKPNNFNICYPPSACGAPSREPVKRLNRLP